MFCLPVNAAPEDEALPLPVLEPVTQPEKREQTPLAAALAPTKTESKKGASKTFLFDFENKELSAVIDEFAAKRGVNIIMPYAIPLNQKLTCKLGKMSLDEAEQYLKTFLEFAGYSLIPSGDYYKITKNEREVITREPLPLYIDVPPAQLPDADRIQVIYYLKNIKVPDSSSGGIDPLSIILNDTLTTSQRYQFDSKANGIIITDKGSNIKATMSMILELDSLGIRDTLRPLRLFNSNATTVANLLQSQIIAVGGDQRGRLKADVKSEAGLYFAPGTKVVADARTNTLIIMGKEPAVERIIEFVQQHIDLPLESGKSILHYRDLQYLDAESFAGVLSKIVAQGIGDSGQATSEGGGGTSRNFEGVIIVPESQVAERVTEAKLAEINARGQAGADVKGTVFRGGNRIIVAARHRDWLRIDKLIQELDKPRLQVLVQIMIVDLDLTDTKILGTQTRNPSMLNLPPGMNFQTTFLRGTTILPTPPTTLATDLLQLLVGGDNPASAAGQLVNNNSGNIGSMIVSLNDTNGSGIWTFLQWLNKFVGTKVISQPHLLALNNTKAEEVVSVIRRVPGNTSAGDGGIIERKEIDRQAALRVAVVPRASSRDRVSLQLSIMINDFVSATSNTITNREVHTNANISSGQMLVLGGLTKYSDIEEDAETPLLGKIPILRWFFSRSSLVRRKTNLTVFIIPTIIEPKNRAGINKFTRDTIEPSYAQIESGVMFDKLQDPVTYFFFKAGGCARGERVAKYNRLLAIEDTLRAEQLATVATAQ